MFASEGDIVNRDADPIYSWAGKMVRERVLDAWDDPGSSPWDAFDRTAIWTFTYGPDSGGSTNLPLPCELYAMTPVTVGVDAIHYNVEWRGSGCSTVHTNCTVPMGVVQNGAEARADYARTHCAPA